MTNQYTTPTLALLRSVAFVDMLRGPANRTYGGCAFVFLLRSRTGEVVAVIEGNTRAARWDSPSGLVQWIAGACGREPRPCQILDMESNRDVKGYAKRLPEINPVELDKLREQYVRDYTAPGRVYVRATNQRED